MRRASEGITGCDAAFFEHASIKAGPAAGQKTLDHARVVESNAELEARQTRFGRLQECRAGAERVADAGLVFETAFDVQVFAKTSPRQFPAELGAPRRIVIDGIDVH